MPDGYGEFVVTHVDRETRFRVDRADPVISVAGVIVRHARLRHGWLHPSVSLDTTPLGERLVIDGVNQRVIYRIGAYHEDGDWYEAAWPD